MTTEESQFDTDQLIADRYRVMRLLGQGGMGKVYLVSDTLLGGDQIALKILGSDLALDQVHTARFLREVQLTRKVTHPNIVRTFDVGTFGDIFFFTMEYAPGPTLKDKAQAGLLGVPEIVEILIQICHGLSAIHSEGIVHRDLKPSNVILGPGGSVKIADFGVARPDTSELTHKSEVIGSTPYMAPEVWRGQELTPAADIYSLGVLAYEVICGRLPFEAHAPAEMMCKHLEETPQPLTLFNATVPRWLNNLILVLLSKDVSERPGGAQEVVELIKSRRSRILTADMVSASLTGSVPKEESTKHRPQNLLGVPTRAESSIIRPDKELVFTSERDLASGRGPSSVRIRVDKTSKRQSSSANLGVVRQRARLEKQRVSQESLGAVSLEAKRPRAGMTSVLGGLVVIRTVVLAAISLGIFAFTIDYTGKTFWLLSSSWPKLYQLPFRYLFGLVSVGVLHFGLTLSLVSLRLSVRNSFICAAQSGVRISLIFTAWFGLFFGIIAWHANQIGISISASNLLLILDPIVRSGWEVFALLPRGTFYEVRASVGYLDLVETQALTALSILPYYLVYVAVLLSLSRTIFYDLFNFQAKGVVRWLALRGAFIVAIGCLNYLSVTHLGDALAPYGFGELSFSLGVWNFHYSAGVLGAALITWSVVGLIILKKPRTS
ncbi:MAG: serine/threonine protein kinase [Bdellovibrionales bacterium]|nr:serine/threonine protein kinase [Bdellovibrionales bacterium]